MTEVKEYEYLYEISPQNLLKILRFEQGWSYIHQFKLIDKFIRDIESIKSSSDKEFFKNIDTYIRTTIIKNLITTEYIQDYDLKVFYHYIVTNNFEEYQNNIYDCYREDDYIDFFCKLLKFNDVAEINSDNSGYMFEMSDFIKCLLLAILKSNIDKSVIRFALFDDIDKDIKFPFCHWKFVKTHHNYFKYVGTRICQDIQGLNASRIVDENLKIFEDRFIK